jgi:C1A family cysteine protease
MLNKDSESYGSMEPVSPSLEQDAVEASTDKYVYLWKIVGGVSFLAVVCLLPITFGHLSEPSFRSSSSLELAKSGRVRYGSLQSSDLATLFDDFKTTYRKSYKTSKEESVAYNNFVSFLELVDERNDAEDEADGTGTHGITKFADLSAVDLKSGFYGFQPVDDVDTLKAKAQNGDNIVLSGKGHSSDTAVDWSGKYTTAVNNQGYCGSCWAFSATEQIESDSIRAGYLTTDDKLSVQQIVSCDKMDDGCDGGVTIYAYYYVYEAGGLQSNESYPYTSYWDTNGACKTDTDDYLVTVTDFYYLTSESAMETYVLNNGPLSVCIDASNWASYTHGILSTCGTTVDHCVQAVGIDTDDGYWLIRNSWGTDWGIDGYIKIKSGVNMCDITYLPTYTTVSKIDR